MARYIFNLVLLLLIVTEVLLGCDAAAYGERIKPAKKSARLKDVPNVALKVVAPKDVAQRNSSDTTLHEETYNNYQYAVPPIDPNDNSGIVYLASLIDRNAALGYNPRGASRYLPPPPPPPPPKEPLPLYKDYHEPRPKAKRDHHKPSPSYRSSQTYREPLTYKEPPLYKDAAHNLEPYYEEVPINLDGPLPHSLPSAPLPPSSHSHPPHPPHPLPPAPAPAPAPVHHHRPHPHKHLNVLENHHHPLIDFNTYGYIPGIPGKPWKDYPLFQSAPYTGFDCKLTKYPGYYADIDTGCQVWHYCQLDGRQDKFLCPNGTIFNQETRVCDWWYNVHCPSSEYKYGVNADLYQVHRKYIPTPHHYHDVPRHSHGLASHPHAFNEVPAPPPPPPSAPPVQHLAPVASAPVYLDNPYFPPLNYVKDPAPGLIYAESRTSKRVQKHEPTVASKTSARNDKATSPSKISAVKVKEPPKSPSHNLSHSRVRVAKVARKRFGASARDQGSGPGRGKPDDLKQTASSPSPPPPLPPPPPPSLPTSPSSPHPDSASSGFS